MVQAQNLEHEICCCHMAHMLLSWFPVLTCMEV